MTRIVNFPSRLDTTAVLPSSKSLSNRALLLCALSGGGAEVHRRSDCDDTEVMFRALSERGSEIDIHGAGTAMRFLTSFFAVCEGEEHVLTGSERMKQRPISALVNALRELGADIDYVEKEGFPPLRIKGRKLQGGTISLPADISSQYVSSLLMIAPMLEQGLTVNLCGEVLSRPYIDMTLELMKSFGAEAAWTDGNHLRVMPVPYRQNVQYTVESDWSAASYWYEMVALSSDRKARVVLPWLFRKSLQGDAAVQHFFEPLGVKTVFDVEHGEVILTKTPQSQPETCLPLTLDLSGQPDLAQTLVVTCAMLRRPFRFTGLRSLRIKETDRMAALHNELQKFGIELSIEGDEALSISRYPDNAPRYDGRPIATYDDHRMAMSFAPAAMVCPGVEIEHPEVVNKSYPRFWESIL